MTPFRDRFTTFQPITADPAGGITGHEITPKGVGTIRQQIDDQVLEVPYVQYIPNIVASLCYDKLKRWGINIYGAINAYSRRLIWVYTGITNRTQVSVATQFCKAVQFHNKFPRIIRSDRGAETSILADIQYDLAVTDMYDKSISPVNENGEALDEWPLREFYVYGTSTKNIRIESWWGQLRRGQTGNWQVRYFSFSNVRRS